MAILGSVENAPQGDLKTWKGRTASENKASFGKPDECGQTQIHADSARTLYDNLFAFRLN